jgi:hypothetical protein
LAGPYREGTHLPRHSKRRSRPLTPKNSVYLKVRVLSPYSFTVKILRESKSLPPQKTIRDSNSKKATGRRVKGKLSSADRAQIRAWLKNWQRTNKAKLTSEQQQIVTTLCDLRWRLGSFTIQRSPTVRNTAGLIERRTAADDLSDLGYDGFNSDQIIQIDDLRNDYDAAICHAIRKGLEDHPWCLEWILQRRNSGDRKAVHRLHRTLPELEGGLPKVIGGREKSILKEIHRLQLNNRNRKLSLRSIHRILRERRLYNKPWSTFHKWVNNPRRRWIIENSSDGILDDAQEPSPQLY